MSLIKKLITSTYPLRMRISKLTGIGINILQNKMNKKSLVSFYSLSAVSNAGSMVNFEKYIGKKVLIVNLASQCGYTPQYEQLEELHQLTKDLVILGFPSNNFGGQEPGTDTEIAEFCRINYGVTFEIFKKDNVCGKYRQPVYEWLSSVDKNGWNNEEPKWNFYKYLVDEEGNLSKIFSSSVHPVETILEDA